MLRFVEDVREDKQYFYAHVSFDGTVLFYGTGKGSRMWEHKPREREHGKWIAEQALYNSNYNDWIVIYKEYPDTWAGSLAARADKVAAIKDYVDHHGYTPKYNERASKVGRPSNVHTPRREVDADEVRSYYVDLAAHYVKYGTKHGAIASIARKNDRVPSVVWRNLNRMRAWS